MESALEIAFVAVASRAGLSLLDSSIRAREWLAAWRKGELAPFYALNPRRSHPNTLPHGTPLSSAIPFEDLAVTFSDSIESGWTGDPESRTNFGRAVQINYIDLAEVVRRVETAHATEAD